MKAENMNTQTTIENVAAEVRAEFDFSIDKFPLSGPDGLTTPWYGLFRSDNGKHVGSGSVTQRYVPHQTDDVVALVEAAAQAFEGEIDVRCYFRDAHFVEIQPTKDYRKAIFGTNDNVFPRFMIEGNYEKKAFNLGLGYWRDACKNLHMMRSVSGTNVTIRHTSGLRTKMDDLIATFQTLRNSWVKLTDVIEHMESKKVCMVDFLDAVYGQPDPESKRGVTVHQNRTQAIFTRLQGELFRTGRGNMPDTFEVSVWEAFNAVQGYVQHEATRKTGFKTDLARIIASSHDAAVKRAEEYAFSRLLSAV